MHTSSHEKLAAFVTTYLTDFRDQSLTILDVGSQVVADQPLSYKPLFNAPAWKYTGLDVEAGLNVDVVPANDYRWDELGADSFDVIVSGQAFVEQHGRGADRSGGDRGCDRGSIGFIAGRQGRRQRRETDGVVPLAGLPINPET